MQNNQLLRCCRVCGFEYANYYPWGEDGNSASYDVCDCCGCEFGYDDDEGARGKGVLVYRQEWFNKGAPLLEQDDKELTQEKKLSTLKQQLSNIGIELDSNIVFQVKNSLHKHQNGNLNAKNFYCLICGLSYTERDFCLHSSCICCNCKFTYDDNSDDAISTYRQVWLNNGAYPFYPDDPRLPKNWSMSHLKTQLANIGFNLTDEMIAEIEKNMRKI